MTDAAGSWIEDEDALRGALEAPLAVLYKHSPLCGLSAIAAGEIERFVAESPDVPVYRVDVIRQRPIAREVARRLNIRHESPQAFVLRDGEVAWHGSHRSVTAEALRRETR